MGGHAGGEVASRITIETLPELFRQSAPSGSLTPSDSSTITHRLHQAIQGANRAIREEAERNPTVKGMGTTVVAVAISQDSTGTHAYIGHAGDSRAYLFKDGNLTLLTRDHTLLEERLALNLITEDQIRTHPLRHILTKGLGIDTEAQPTIQQFQLEPKDLLLLCSDGLTKMLSDAEIRSMMIREAKNPEQIPSKFVETANRLGGEDNTTVVVIGTSFSLAPSEPSTD